MDPDQLVSRIAVTSDAHGFIQQALPNLLTTAGRQYYAQFVFQGNCQGMGGWTSSNALHITVQ